MGPIRNEELRVMMKIAKRALSERYMEERITRATAADLVHSIRIVHSRIVRLRLKEMLICPVADLAHDIRGMLAHLDLPNHKLVNGWLPWLREGNEAEAAYDRRLAMGQEEAAEAQRKNG